MSEQASFSAAAAFVDRLPAGLPKPEIIISGDGYHMSLVWSAGRAARLELRFTGTARSCEGKWEFGGLPDFPGGETWVTYPRQSDITAENGAYEAAKMCKRYNALLAKIELVGLLQRLRDAK